MSLLKVLNEDWSDYETRKNDKEHRFIFSCEEEWEVHYLIKKIRSHHSYLSTDEIKSAIDACCRQVSPPRPRSLFVQCVMRKFGIM